MNDFEPLKPCRTYSLSLLFCERCGDISINDHIHQVNPTRRVLRLCGYAYSAL